MTRGGGGYECDCCADLYNENCIYPPPPPPPLSPAPTPAPPPDFTIVLSGPSLSGSATTTYTITTPSAVLHSAANTLLTVNPSSGWSVTETAYTFSSYGTTVATSLADAQSNYFTDVSVTLTWSGPANATSASASVSIMASTLTGSAGNSNIASNTVKTALDLADPSFTIDFGGSVNRDNYTTGNTLTVTLSTSDTAYGWNWAKVQLTGGTSAALSSSADGLRTFTFVVNITVSEGNIEVYLPVGVFQDSAGRRSAAALAIAFHAQEWSRTVGTVANATVGSTVGAAVGVSVASSVMAGGTGTAAAAGAAGGAVSGASTATAATTTGSSGGVVGPSHIAGTMNAHLLSMVGHIQFISLLGSVDAPMPQGFRGFSESLNWTTLQGIQMPWTPTPPTTSTVRSFRRRLLDEVADKEKLVASAFDFYANKAYSSASTWGTYYTSLVITGWLLTVATTLRFLGEHAWKNKQQRMIHGNDLDLAAEWKDRVLPAWFLFPMPELMVYDFLLPGLALSSAQIITTHEPVAIAVGCATIIVGVFGFMVTITLVITRWNKHATFFVEKDATGVPRDRSSVFILPGAWEDTDDKRFVDKYGAFFSGFSGPCLKEDAWYEERRQDKEGVAAKKESQVAADTSEVITIQFKDEAPVIPTLDFLNPEAIRAARYQHQAYRENAPTARAELPFAGVIRRMLMRLFLWLGLSIRPHHVRVVTWTFVMGKDVVIGIAAGLSADLGEASYYIIAATTFFVTLHIYIWAPMTEVGSLIVEMIVCLSECASAVLLILVANRDDFRNNSAVDISMIVLCITSVVLSAVYSYFMMFVIAMLTSLGKRNAVLGEKEAFEREEKLRSLGEMEKVKDEDDVETRIALYELMDEYSE